MSFIGDTGLVPLVVNNPQLQTLSLAECNITDLSLDKIAKFSGEGVSWVMSFGCLFIYLFVPSFLPS